MAEIAHTCINASPWGTNLPPCLGCQAHHDKIYAKEKAVLAAALALAGSDLGRDDGTMLRVAREYAALKKGSGRGW